MLDIGRSTTVCMASSTAKNGGILRDGHSAMKEGLANKTILALYVAISVFIISSYLRTAFLRDESKSGK